VIEQTDQFQNSVKLWRENTNLKKNQKISSKSKKFDLNKKKSDFLISRFFPTLATVNYLGR